MKNTNAIFPDIDYDFWFSEYDWDNIGTLRRMISNMQNNGCLDLSINAENITDAIKLEIETYIKGENKSNLKNICLLIQTWGGSSGRIHTPLIFNNWEDNGTEQIYLSFVETLLSGDYVGSYNLLNQVHGLGPSFIAKHVCFWSGKGDRQKGIPILDDVIAKLIYSKKRANQIEYGDFIKDFENISIVKKLKPAEVEMALFAFSGYYWGTANTATNDFKANVNEKSKDYKQAKLIAERYAQHYN